MGTAAPNGRSVATAPMLLVGTLPTRNGANKTPSAAAVTRSGDNGKFARMVPSYLRSSAGHGAASGTQPLKHERYSAQTTTAINQRISAQLSAFSASAAPCV